MELLLQVVRWEVAVFLLGLAGIVAFQLMTGRINTRKLLSTKQGGSKGAVSPERVQLLLMTLGTAGYYVMQASAAATSGHLPAVPNSWPAAIGGSNLIYLAGKAFASFSSKSTTN